MRVFLALLFLGFQSHAQLGYDIWFGDIGYDQSSGFGLSKLKNATQLAGYDNQPFFLPTGDSFLFTSDRGGVGTDIYIYDMSTHRISLLTKTPASEFSPQLLPNGSGYSTVRIDPDEIQRFWILDQDAEEKESLFGLENVGYNCWFNNDEVFFFLVGEEEEGGHQLAWAQVSKNKVRVLDRGIGRSLFSYGNSFYYTRDLGAGQFQVISLTATEKTGKFETNEVTMLPAGTQDFVVYKGKFLLTVNDNTLLTYDLQNETGEWDHNVKVLDGNTKEVTRIAIDEENGKIAFVIAE